MSVEQAFNASVSIAAPADQVFAYHERPGAFERLTPPWERLQIIERHGGIQDGGVMRARLLMAGPFGPLWEAHHRGYIRGIEFLDEQVRGPFASWTHRHRFESEGPHRSRLHDEISYRLPCGAPGQFFGGTLVRRRLEGMFRYRHVVTAADNERLAAMAGHGMWRIIISGASGVIGTALTRFLTLGGHTVVPLVRRPGGAGIYWNPETSEIDREALEGADAVVHLSGENVAARRWTPEFRRGVASSRRQGTALLAAAVAGMKRPPRVFVSAGAIGYYGDRGDTWLEENSSGGDGFLADVCQQWESASVAAEKKVRTVRMRIGVVLTTGGGALAELIGPARLGISTRFGSGNQFVSWIGLDDTVYGIYHALFDERLSGPINLVAPEPVRQAELVRTLARVLGRPALGFVPRFVVRFLLGRDKADEILLVSQRVRPRKLSECGFEWLHPTLEKTLRHVLGAVPPR